MKILAINANCEPRECIIDGSLESMQEVVGGNIEVLTPFNDDVVLVCNEEGALLNLPFNRMTYNPEIGFQHMIYGNFFLCCCSDDCESLVSLNDDLISKYTEMFSLCKVNKFWVRDKENRDVWNLYVGNLGLSTKHHIASLLDEPIDNEYTYVSGLFNVEQDTVCASDLCEAKDSVEEELHEIAQDKRYFYEAIEDALTERSLWR